MAAADVRKNMPPQVWGASGWRTLYLLARAFKGKEEGGGQEHDDALMKLFSALPHVLPCTSCRANVLNELQMYPPKDALASNAAALQFVNRVHNSVSARLRKPQHTLAQHWGIEYWGSSAVWDFLVAVAYAYPPAPTPEESQALCNLFNAISVLLPHMASLAKNAADAAASRDALRLHVQLARNAALDTNDSFDGMVTALIQAQQQARANAKRQVIIIASVSGVALILLLAIILFMVFQKRR